MLSYDYDYYMTMAAVEAAVRGSVCVMPASMMETSYFHLPALHSLQQSSVELTAEFVLPVNVASLAAAEYAVLFYSTEKEGLAEDTEHSSAAS